MFKTISCLAFILSVIATEGCPTIKGRSTWGATSPKSVKRNASNLGYVVIHHTASSQCSDANACSGQVKSIQNGHMSAKRGFDDIGYNFLIDQFGNIYEGRGWGVLGAHAPGYNSKSVGISILGNYQNSAPSSQAIQAAKSLINCGVSNGKISSNYKLLGHRQTKATECPGQKLYEEIKTWPNWVANP